MASILVIVACKERDDPSRLEFVTSALPNGRLGMAYEARILVQGGTGSYLFSLTTGTLPAGLSLIDVSGQIGGTPNAEGVSSFTVHVQDTTGQFIEQAFEIAVVPPLAIVSDPILPAAFVGRTYAATLETEGGIAPIQFEISSGQLPTGLALTPSGAIEGVPAKRGTETFTVQATDAEGLTARKAGFSLSVQYADLTIVTSSVPAGLLHQPYEAHLTAEGGTPPYLWELTGGALPFGLRLDVDGTVSGSPTLIGSRTFSVQVTDSNDDTDDATLSMEIVAPLTIETRAVPFLEINVAADVQFIASGGLAPYRWSLETDDVLPPGLTLSVDGRLSGTPTERGDFPITIRLQDATNETTVTADLTVRVLDLIDYTFEPNLDFPAVCTATVVSYVSAELPVPDSFAIAPGAMQVTIDVAFTDTAAQNNQRLKLVLWAPDGRRSVLCGNGAGVRLSVGCPGSGGIQEVYGPTAASPNVPFRVFDEMNPQGIWRLSAAVVNPTTTENDICEQAGTIRSVRLTMAPDFRPERYVIVKGFTRNNLLIDPWVRLKGGGILTEQSITLQATLWDPGPNGAREGGRGDDIPVDRAFTWTGQDLPFETTISPEGEVSPGSVTGGNGSFVTATDSTGEFSVTLPLYVTPPDFVTKVRAF